MSVGQSIAYDLQYYQSTLEPILEMAISIQDQQLVFLAYQPLFRGQNTHLRNGKPILALLKAHEQHNSAVANSLGLKKVVSILKILLERQIFQSPLKAKLAFPVLYETSPEQDAQHEASDEGAAKDEAEALHEVEASARVEKIGRSVNQDTDTASSLENASTQQEQDIFQIPACANELPVTNPGLPSLYPVQFPLHLQHDILCRVQRLLEECCYDFTKRYAPKVLDEQAWDCPEAIELNKWTLMFLNSKIKLPSHLFKKTSSSPGPILTPVNHIRHAAVHRLRTSARGVHQMIQDAIKFAETLADTIRASMLQAVLYELNVKMQSQELNKNFLETRLKAELDDIEVQRQKLSRREEEAIKTILTQDQENTMFVSSLLKESMQQLFSRHHLFEEALPSDVNLAGPSGDEEEFECAVEELSATEDT